MMLALAAAVSAALMAASPGALPAADSVLLARMASPQIREAVSARDGATFAWIENRSGRQTVFIGGPASRRAIAEFPDDDGRALGSLGITPDGRWVFFARSAYGEENIGGMTSAARITLHVVDQSSGRSQAIPANVSSVVALPGSSGLVFSAGSEISRATLYMHTKMNVFLI